MAVKIASRKRLGYLLFIQTALAVLVPLLRFHHSADPGMGYGLLLRLHERSYLLLPHICSVSAIARQLTSFATRHQKMWRHPRVSTEHSLMRNPAPPVLAAQPNPDPLPTTIGSEQHAGTAGEVNNAPVMARNSDHTDPDSWGGILHYNNSLKRAFDTDAVKSNDHSRSSSVGLDSRNSSSSSRHSSNPNLESISSLSNDSEAFTINRDQLHRGEEPGSHNTLEHLEHNDAATNSHDNHYTGFGVTISWASKGNSNAKNHENSEENTSSPIQLKDANSGSISDDHNITVHDKVHQKDSKDNFQEGVGNPYEYVNPDTTSQMVNTVEPDNHNITTGTEVPEEDRRNNNNSGPEGTGESDDYNTTTRNEVPLKKKEDSVKQGPETPLETLARDSTAAKSGNEQDNINSGKNLTNLAGEDLVDAKRAVLYALDNPSKSAEQVSVHSANSAPLGMPDAQLDAVQTVLVEAAPRTIAERLTERGTSAEVKSLTNSQRHHQSQKLYRQQQIEKTNAPHRKHTASNASGASSNSEPLIQQRQEIMSAADVSFRNPDENPAITSGNRSRKRNLQHQRQQHILSPDKSSVIDLSPSTGVPSKPQDQDNSHDMHYVEKGSGSSFVASKQLGKAEAQQQQKQKMQALENSYTGPDSKRYPCIQHNKSTNGAPLKVESNVRTEQKCQWLCQKIGNCTHAVLDRSALTCALKTGYIEISDKDGSTVVPRSCNDCWSINTTLSGEKLQSTRSNVYAPVACLSLCLNNPNCKYFTYEIFRELCDIYGAEAEGTQQQSENYIMGPAKWCSLSAAELKAQEGWGEGTGAGWVKSQCMQPPNTQAGGHPFEILADIVTADICQKECQKRTRCLYFSFNREDHQCQLIDTGGYNTKSANQYVAGPRTCNTTCFKAGAALPKDVSSSERKMNTLMDCQVFCYESQNCRTFSYCTDTMICLQSSHSPREFGLQSDEQESEADNETETETPTELDTDNGNCFLGSSNFCGAAAIQKTV